MAEESNRIMHTYKIPPTVSREYTEVQLVELKASEERLASKRGQNEAMKTVFEMAKQALYSVNGKRVSTGDMSADKIWDELPPKVRSLILAAYQQHHSPSEDEVADFLKSGVAVA